MNFSSKQSLCAMLKPGAIALVTLLTACGDGGSNNGINSVSEAGQGGAACPDSSMQCTGSAILRTDQGIGMTASGVQVYAVSTNDLQDPNPTPTFAVGLQPQTGGLADIRVTHDANGAVASVALLLSKLGLSWDGKTERPLIIETFEKRQGRVQLDTTGHVVFSALPPPTDLNFYDYARKGAAATQANYANNIYFPRTDPSRCPADAVSCPLVETTGIQTQLGDWRTGGTTPDNTSASRLHEDGATQAGFGLDANGNQVLLPDATGPGVPYPGFKGYRNYHQWNYQYTNLAAWITQDTVLINEWGGGHEHNKARRGLVAFGPVTAPAQIPTTGVVRYSGRLHAWWSYDPSLDSYPIFGDIVAEVDFAARTVKISVTGTRIDEGTLDAVPMAVTASTSIGGAPYTNYFQGAVGNSSMSGGLGARFFGPVTSGGSGTGPAEIGGSLQLQTPGNGPVAIGGFLLRKI